MGSYILLNTVFSVLIWKHDPMVNMKKIDLSDIKPYSEGQICGWACIQSKFLSKIIIMSNSMIIIIAKTHNDC